MSRINHDKKKKEKTEDYTFKSVSSNKRIYKKVGHKGDYAVVKTGSSFITSVMNDGSGTVESPFIYTIDLDSGLKSKLAPQRVSSIALKHDSKTERYKLEKNVTALNSKKKSLKIIDFQASINYTDNDVNVFEFGRDNKSKYTLSSFNNILNKNNQFAITFTNELSRIPVLNYGCNKEGYDIDVVLISKKIIRFKITYNKLDITNRYLSSQDDLDISFVIEW